jgi:aminoglycoside/choline kinase family phosphotransferase
VISVVDKRRALLANWLQEKTPFKDGTLSIASADASFRRYFRLIHQGQSYIVMDAPPDLEPSLPFVQIGQWMNESGIRVPEIFAQDLDLGFLILSDFGDHHYQDALVGENRQALYQLAIDEITKFQSSLTDSKEKLPLFDQAWQKKELDIFREWCLPGLSATEYLPYTQPLLDQVDQIPKAFMHRDFHCRNLLLCPNDQVGIIDFQGAMHGPITYDLVSLTRDCYVDNDENWIRETTLNFQNSLLSAGLEYAKVEADEFIRWLDFAGIQRHLKCVGIFHRLKIRDQKPSYMKDVPRVLKYINTVLDRNPVLRDLKELVDRAEILT